MERKPSSPKRLLHLLLLLAALASACTGQYFLSIEFVRGWAALGWTGAVVLFAGAYIVAPPLRALPSLREEALPLRWEQGLALAVLALGWFFKVYKLSEFPPGLNHDAAWEGQYALHILNGAPYTPFISAAWGRETLTFYFRAVTVWLLGNTPMAVILPSVVAGILVLPFLYWWARLMFGARTALLVTALFGVSGWSLVFSRSGWRSDFQPLFTVITCCFFLRGMETRRAVDFALAGIGMAATLNTYNAARAFPLLFLLWIPLFVAQGWTLRGFLRAYGKGYLAGALAFLVSVAPLAWYAINNWQKFNARAQYLMESFSPWNALRATPLLFHWRANGDDFFTNTPGLEFWAAVFFVFGLLWCLFQLRDSRAQFLLIGFAVGLIPGLLSNPNLNRDVGTMPFVFFFAGLGVVYVVRSLAWALPRPLGLVGSASLAVAVVTASAVATYAQFLGPNRREVWGFYPETTVLGQYMASIMPRYRVWVGGANFPNDTLIYLTYQGGDPFTPRFVWLPDIVALLSLPLPEPREQGLAFILANHTVGRLVLQELARRYPQHEIVELRYPPQNGQVFAVALLVPPGVRPVAPAEIPPPSPEAKGETLEAELREPRAVLVLPDGGVVVSDFGHDRLQWRDRDLRPLRSLGGTGSEPLRFRQPCGLALASDGEVYVADTWNHRIQVLSPDGSFRRQLLASFFSPRGVAVSGGKVFVADSGNDRVVVLDAEGQLLEEWRGDEKSGRLREPIGIAVAKDGSVFVADNGNARVVVFDKAGRVQRTFAVPGLESRAFSEPQLAFDSKGRLWITVPLEHEVRCYDAQGKLVQSLEIRDGNDLRTPLGVAVRPGKREELLFTTLEGEIRSIALP